MKLGDYDNTLYFLEAYRWHLDADMAPHPFLQHCNKAIQHSTGKLRL